MINQTFFSKRKFSYVLKILTVCCSLGGVLLSLIFARRDGYSHWTRRTFYFTAQSNMWIGFTTLAILLLPLLPLKLQKIKNFLYLFKYVFTVCIAMTAIVFLGFLAPFADQSYHVWEFSSFLTHVFSPLFAILDFFVDDYKINLNKNSIFLVAVPPLFYIGFSAVLSAFSVDFGRGVNYPYFFMNHYSKAGVFGFSKEVPLLGTFYWICFFAIITMCLGFFFAKIKNKTTK